MARTKRPADYTTKNIWETCGKCMGTGSIAWGMAVKGAVREADGTVRYIGKVCFQCGGTRGKYVSQSQLDRRVKDRERRDRKREAERVARVAAAEAEAAETAANLEKNQAAFKAEHPGTIEALSGLGSFGADLMETFNASGALTTGQVEAVARIVAERASDPAPAPVEAGRGNLTGRIITAKNVESDFGTTPKMLLLDDRGFKAWGTIPSTLSGDFYQAWLAEVDQPKDHGPETWLAFAKGQRVSLTATVTASEDDEAFGFFKRPAKAEVI